MTKRLNFLVQKNAGIEALVAVEAWLAKSFDPKLLDLVKVRVSQMNGCAYCLHMHRQDALKHGETEDRLLLLSAWRKVRALHGAGTSSARMGRVPHAHRGEPRTRCGLRGGAERLLRRRTRRTFDRGGHDQRLEQARDRLSPAASDRPEARGLSRRIAGVHRRCANRIRLDAE